MKPSVLSTVVAFAAGSLAASTDSLTCDPPGGYDIQYTTLQGYFLQDEPSTSPDNFDYAAHNFGLLNRTYPTDSSSCGSQSGGSQWQRFARWVDYLNSGRQRFDENGNRVIYKVVFFGRHGEGWHNAAESFYGTPAWNCYYGELDGNGTASWSDALLTDNGFAQAYKANAYYKQAFAQGLPYFESYYSSPLRRCIQTSNATFATLSLPATHPFQPTIKELFREGISVHTCDRRSNKTDIHAFAPAFRFEPGFAERDPLWRGAQHEGETSAHQLARSQAVLDDVFTNDANTWINVASHSGEIGSMLSVLGHRSFSLSTGQIIPVFIKAVFAQSSQASAAAAAAANATMTTTTTTSADAAGFAVEVLCNSPPVTSISGNGCVCSGGGPMPVTSVTSVTSASAPPACTAKSK